MSTLANVLAILEKWPAWKRITQAPDRVDSLEARITALEAKLARAPGEACPGCGELAMRAIGDKKDPSPFGVMGIQVRDFRCEACGYTTSRQLRP